MKGPIFKLGTIVVLLYGIIEGVDNRRLRWKRQTLPSDNVQVHSFDSNVTIEDQVIVTSSNSRIELSETHFGATIWSNSSLLRFNPNDEYVNLTATNAISTFYLNSAEFITFGQHYSLNESTNRKTDGESQLYLSLQNAVNLSLSDNATSTQVEAVNGRRAQINANTWNVQMARKLTLSSNVLQNYARELTITSVSDKYNVAIILDGAKIALLYGKVRVDIQPDYRKLILTTETHKVELETYKSKFDLSLTEEELLIRAPDESTALQIKPNSSDIAIAVDQLSQMAVDRFGGGSLRLQGKNAAAEALQLDSQELSLFLLGGNNSESTAIISNSNRSRLALQTNLTKASLTAGHHFIQILGGAPHLLLYTGNVTLDVSSNTKGLSAVRLMPQFIPPEDQFQNIGPYGNESDSSYIFPTSSTGINNGGANNGRNETRSPNSSGTGATVSPVTAGNNQMASGQGTTPPTATNEDTQNPNPGFILVTPSPAPTGSNIPNASNQSGGNSDGNPEAIDLNFPRPATPFPPNTSDNFIIGQFGTEIVPTSPTIEGFPIFATITNIALPDNSTFTDDFPTPPVTMNSANTTAIYLISTSTPLRMVRDDHSAGTKGLMQVKLRVERSVNNDDEGAIIAELEKGLTELVESAISNGTDEEEVGKTRKKRMLNEVDVRVYDLMRNDADPDAMVVKFYVDKPDYFRDLPFLATKLNAFGHQMLSDKLKYKVISPIKVHQSITFGVTLFAIVCAFIIMALLIVLTVKCTSQKKTWLKYAKRRKVEDIPQMVTI